MGRKRIGNNVIPFSAGSKTAEPPSRLYLKLTYVLAPPTDGKGIDTHLETPHLQGNGSGFGEMGE